MTAKDDKWKNVFEDHNWAVCIFDVYPVGEAKPLIFVNKVSGKSGVRISMVTPGHFAGEKIGENVVGKKGVGKGGN